MESYDFKITPYDTENLLPQVSEALQRRTELLSRERYPGLWKNIDKLNTMSQGKQRSSRRTNVMSILCVVLGMFLLIPGLMNPQELTVPLIAGILAILIGILYLCSSRGSKKYSFDESAKLLLMGKDTLSTEQSIVVSFTGTGMEVQAADKDSQQIPYSDFELAIETSDLYLFVHDTRITVLQKKDMASGSTADFRDFISKNIPQYQSTI